MTDKMKQFLEAVSGDKEYIEKLTLAQDTAAVIDLAKEKGFNLTEEDLQQDARIQNIPDDELDAIAGGSGKGCVCVAGGGGEAGYKERTCACVVYGQGEVIKDGKIVTRCVCPFVGCGD